MDEFQWVVDPKVLKNLQHLQQDAERDFESYILQLDDAYRKTKESNSIKFKG